METVVLSASESKAIPEHFPHASIRPLQKAAIHAIQEAWGKGYRYVFLEAPTGFGKSAVGITLARQIPKAFILVSTKMLQDQYIREKLYKTIQVKGRANFRCLLSKKRNCTCDVGPCQLDKECDYKPRRGSEGIPIDAMKIADTAKDELWAYPNLPLCLYWEQKCDALNHRYPVMNYSYFLHETTHAHDFGKRRLMICDEAHNMEDELMRFISFSISDSDLELVHCKIPTGNIPISKWIENLKEWERNMTLEYENSRKAALGTSDSQKKTELMKKMQELAEKIDKCGFIAKELSIEPGNWLIDLTENKKSEKTGKNKAIEDKKVRKVTFRPIFVKRWGGKFSGMADNFLLQSATIIYAESIAESLNLPQDECVFLRAGSEFIPARRPIYYKPIGRMSRTHDQIHKTLPKLVDEIRSLIEKYPDMKGVIHTHTYKIQDYILKNINSPRFIANRAEDSKKRDRIFREFIDSKKPKILVTPSAYEGMDFKDDICRFQVLCKIPYPDLGDKQISKRKDINASWYQWKTILRLVQTYGRGTRSKTDWCHTYLFDSNFSTLWERDSRSGSISGRKLFPEWFTEAIVNVR